MSLISLKKRLRSTLLRAILSTVYSCLVLLGGLTRLQKHIRLSLLKIILILTYCSVVTPIAWRERATAGSPYAWTKNDVNAGWHDNDQSTEDPQLYSSGRGELLSLRQQKRNYDLLMYDILRPMKILAEPPTEKELSSDLYVMF